MPVHLPPIPASTVILFALALLLVYTAVATAKRRVRREMGKQLRQAFVAGFAAGSGVTWAVGRRVQPRIQRVPM